LHTLLPALFDERAEVGEVRERGLVLAALRPDRQRRAGLRDHDADVAGGHLHPRELLHAIERPELEPQPGHEQLGLVPGLAAEGDRVVLAELLQREALGDEADLGCADRVERRENSDEEESDNDDGDDSNE
jgi:hypothetical protein